MQNIMENLIAKAYRLLLLHLEQPSLVVLKNGLRHLVPHVILHLVIYRLSIFFKMADDIDFSI